MSSDLDWTLADAPDPAEPPRPAEKRALASATARRIVWIIGALLVVVVLGLGYYWQTGEARTRRDIEHLIGLEEQAARDRDIRYFRTLVADDSSEWIKTQVRWMIRGLAAPVPLTLLRPSTGAVTASLPARLTTLTPFAPAIVRADVTRAYSTTRGETVSFNLAQFYRYANGEWKRIPPPDAYQGDLQFYFGHRLEVRYYTVDAARVRALIPLVEQILAQACAQWTCADGFRFSLYFTDPAYAPDYDLASPTPAASADEPLLFDWVLASHYQSWGAELYLPASTGLGYPADEFSADYYRRFIARQVLLQTAGYLVLERGDVLSGPELSRNAYFYALVARLAAQVGLEAPETLTLTTSSVPLAPDVLWDWGFGIDGAFQYRPFLRTGLAVVNRLVASANQPLSITERALFRNLPLSADSSAWLATALEISPDSAQARLVTLASESFKVNVLVTHPPDLLLGCDNGPLTYSLGDPAPRPLLAGEFSNTFLGDWSPDGQRSLFYLYNQTLALDFTSGTVQVLPFIQSFGAPWASDSIIAYYMDSSATTSQPFLKFYDLANPAHTFPTLAQLQNYVLAPDGVTAAVMRTARAANALTNLEIMPALGGPFQYLDGNITFAPRSNGTVAWSPDSQRLAYTRLTADNVASIRIVDVASGDIRAVVRGYDLDAAHPPTAAALVWSPDGARLGFAAMNPDRQTSWIGLVNADDSDLRVLSTQPGIFFQIHFSADGRYLAAAYYDFTESQKLALFDTLSGERLAFLKDAQDFSWSPTGHQLAFVTTRSVNLLAEPNGQPQVIANTKCNNIAWRPTP